MDLFYEFGRHSKFVALTIENLAHRVEERHDRLKGLVANRRGYAGVEQDSYYHHVAGTFP
jgi:hypothetical protein